MTIAEWLPSDVVRSAGSALLHSLWQGTAVAAVAAIAMSLARRASARYVIAVVALALMVAAPVATFALLYAGGAPPRELAVASLTAALGHARDAGAVSVAAPGAAPEYVAWLVALWLAGVVAFGGRAAGGVVVLGRVRRRPSTAVGPALEALCEGLRRELGVARAVRYLQCDWLESPAVVGFLRPIIYLPLAALSSLSEAQLRAVIAHELAHVKRLDALVNGFQIVAEALLFYHPATWWLNRRIREERENCCDDVAAAACGDPVDYARALLSLEELRGAPSLAMAATGGALRARIGRLLAYEADGPSLRAAPAIAGAVFLSAALFVGMCVFGLEFGASWNVNMRLSHAASAPPPVGAEGEATPSVDQLVTLRVHGVTPEFVRRLREAGYSPDVDDLVAMRVHGVSLEYIAELGERGYPRLDVDDLVAFRVHGVTPAFIAAVQQLGYAHPAPSDLVAMRVHDVTPEYVAELRRLGVPGLGDIVNRRARAD